MPKFGINALTLAAALAAALLARLGPPSMGWTPAIAGVLLLVVLFVFDREGYRTMWQSAAYAGVAGYCLLVSALGALPLLNGFWPQYVPASVAFFWQPVFWTGATILLLVIDRVRADSRAPRSLFPSYIPPVAPRAVTEPPPAPEPVPVQASAPEPIPAIAVEPEPLPPPPPQPAVPAPRLIEIPAGAGKPATIYLNLVGEGLTCLRSVQAEHLGRDFYRIVEPVPQGENWEFSTGQIVRCKKRTLSSGKAMVAVEEAPRAN